MPKPSQRLEAIVSGNVQGVGFRYHTQRMARQLGLVGCVANLIDGTVQVVSEGDPAQLQAFEQFLRTGPPAAVVAGLQTNWTEPTGTFESFQIGQV